MAGIYCIKNIISDKIYIGQTIRSFNLRFNEHKSRLRTNKHKNKHLQNSWNKHGPQQFLFEIIELIPSSEFGKLDSQEKYWIEYYKQNFKVFNLGNEIKNPMRGRKHSEETKAKMKGRKSSFKNHTHTTESIAQIKEKRKFQDCSKLYKKIERIDPNTGEIKEYQSIKSTKEDGFLPNKIVECCKNRANIHRGFYWCYMENIK